MGGEGGKDKETPETCLGKLRAADNKKNKYILYDNGQKSYTN